SGWQNNWFASVSRTAVRYTALVAWERIKSIRGRTHDFTMSGELSATSLTGTVAEHGLVVEDENGRVVRTVDFGDASSIGAHDHPMSLAVRDVWHASDRMQVDAGLRADHSQ